MLEIRANAKIDGLKKLAEGKIFKETMDKVANIAKKECKDHYVPVNTEDLKKSIFVEIVENGYILGATAKHAVFNEYGSITTPIGSVKNPKDAKKTGYRPFIRPSIYKANREYPEIFGKKYIKLMTG